MNQRNRGQREMGPLRWAVAAGATLAAASQSAMAGNAAVTVLHYFTGPDGDSPYSALYQASDGWLYGTTQNGGPNDAGTVYRIATNGTFYSLHSFAGLDGIEPLAALTAGTDGYLYGSTNSGGASWAGTAFKISSTGTFTMLHTFGSAAGEGGNLWAALTLGTDGNFYGGTGSNPPTVFRMTPQGALTTLVGGNGSQVTSGFGSISTLVPVQGKPGVFYGVAAGIGDGPGRLFQVSQAGVFQLLYQFPASPSDQQMIGTLAQDSAGNLYGTTMGNDGWTGMGPPFWGSAFKWDAHTGQVTTLHTFHGPDGGRPLGGLTLGSDGYLYGTTFDGGSTWISPEIYGFGTIFRISPSGDFTTLYSFTGTDGGEPTAAPIQASDCSFYGTTTQESSNYNTAGTIYKLTLSAPIAPPAPTLKVKYTGTTLKVPTLTWNAISCAASYNVYYGDTAGGESATPLYAGLTATQVKGLLAVEGFYRVAAVNAVGVGPLSNEIFASTWTTD